MTSETKMLKGLTLGLLGVMIVMGLVFVVAGKYQETICEDIDGEYYNSGTCQESATNTTVKESEAYTQTGEVRDAIKLLVSFLTIIVLILIVKMLLSASKSFAGE